MNLPPISMDVLVTHAALLSKKSYRLEFMQLSAMYLRSELMTELQKDQLVSYSFSIYYELSRKAKKS